MSNSNVIVGVLDDDNLVSSLTNEDPYIHRVYSGAETATYESVDALVKAVNRREVAYGLLPERSLGQHCKDVRILEEPRAVEEVDGTRKWTDYALITMGERTVYIL